MRRTRTRQFCLLAVVLFVSLLLPPSDGHSGEDPTPTLTNTARVGTVAAGQGGAFVRPAGRRRWSRLSTDDLLLPGDLLKASARGANALEVALTGGGSLVLGPGALVEIPGRATVRVLRGEVEIRGKDESAVNVAAPGRPEEAVRGTAWLRVERGTTQSLAEAPRWLKGYRDSVGEEWMGSLLAKVDGRDVPLAVGYHRVTADVRDRVARTTVEQSFVNSTDQRLEGVFYFPLPADASISGFGMWIGGELVEADIVEKARARQIYEDILRRKKDPGLLEWQGGNLFKARVFPIEPRSEKRIRIRYTQVLRLEGATFRYRYALRSDLLRSKPLRRLDIQVNVLSDRAIAKVACPSHEARITATDHEARVEFDAEEFVPEKDLEVAVTLETGSGITGVAHRRGDDGYFMLLLAPPEGEGAGWQRDLTPDGEPLDVRIVADTSGSMDAAARAVQATFLESLLSLLGEEDRVQIYAADVDVHPVFESPASPTEENVAGALAALDARPSLGWSDLDGTFARVLAGAGESTLVVYVGDGVPTTGDANPERQASRLRALAGKTPATVHAIAPSSTYEQGVLEAMAAIGGGSVRRADGDATGAAYSLLAEAARPAVRDLTVEITGVPTARVYPRMLPNLPLGTQQVVLGRYLPSDDAARATVVVRGTLDGKPVSYRASLSLPAPDAGNSFLPRLWARKHLDHLLQQGTSPEVKEEIVSFSREFGIMTPHTSFLVLESDADRERYGVTRTVKMRDGESYFAEGRDKVALEMARKASREARTWRTGLRRRMVREIAGLGRDLIPTPGLREVAWGWGGGGGGVSGFGYTSLEHAYFEDEAGDGFFTGRTLGGDRGVAVERLRSETRSVEAKGKKVRGDWGGEGQELMEREAPSGERSPPAPEELAKDEAYAPEDSLDQDFDKAPARKRRGRRPSAQPTPVLAEDARLGRLFGEPTGPRARGGYRYLEAHSIQGRREQLYRAAIPQDADLGFPLVPFAGRERPKRPDPAWSPAVLEGLRALDRRAAFAAMAGGVRIVQEGGPVHPVRGDPLGARKDTALVSAARWFTRTEEDLAEPSAAWLDAEKRAAVREGRRQGRRRAAVERDRRTWTFALRDFSLDDLVDLFRRQDVVLDGGEGDVVRVRIRSRDLEGVDRVLTIDRARRLLLEDRAVIGDRVLSRTVYADPVQVAGIWWATKIEYRDHEDRVFDRYVRKIEALDPAAFDTALAQAESAYDDVLWLEGDLPKVKDAKQAAAEDRATFADHIALTLHAAWSQRWDEALAAWQAAKALAGDKPGVFFAEVQLLRQARRGDELLAHLRALAATPPERGAAVEAWTAPWALQQAAALGPRERLGLARSFGPRWVAGGRRWARSYRAALAAMLDQAGRQRNARQVRAETARLFPHDVGAQQQHANDLLRVGRIDDARRLLRDLVKSREKPVFTERELDMLHGQRMDVLWSVRDWPALAQAADDWRVASPSSTDAIWRDVSLLYLRGDAAEALATADRWVAATLAPETPLPVDPRSPGKARLEAALRLALGVGWHFSGRIEDMFVDPLVDVTLGMATVDPQIAPLAGSVTQNWRFRRTDGYRRLLEAWRQDLLKPGALRTLPVRQIVRTASWLSWAPSEVDPDVFQTVVDGIEARRKAVEDDRERRALGRLLVTLHDQHGTAAEAAAVVASLREQASGLDRYEWTLDLFDRLLKLEGSAERADLLFALLPDLLDPYAPDAHRLIAANASRRLAAWYFDYQKKMLVKSLVADAELTRAEAREATKLAIQTARGNLAARFQSARDMLGKPFAPWLEVERLGYLVQRGEDLPDVEAAARELLDTLPRAPKEEDALSSVLAERAVLVLDYASTRRNAPDGLADRTLALLRTREETAGDKLLDWRFERFRLLVALDRVETIEAALRSWIRPTDVQSAWRITLGYVLAETGRLDEAAALFEEVAARDELSASEWSSLAGWYLVLGNDEARETALDGRYAAMPEHELSNLVYRAGSRLARRGKGVPEDLDPETLRAMRALIRKASHPENYTWQIRRIYQAVKDHRLLESLAEGLPGHSPEGVYPLVARLGEITREIHEEATIDAALARVRALLGEADETASGSVDRRALLLFEALLEGRASLVPNPEPGHGERALAALQQAFEGTWVPGESRQVAAVLASMGKLPDPALAKEQLRQLEVLRDRAEPTSPDRLSLAHALARALKAYGRLGDATAVLRSALAEVREHEGPALPTRADHVFRDLVNWTVAQRHYREAETELEAEIRRRELVLRRTPLEQRLLLLYAQAVQGSGDLSIGSGAALVDEAARLIDTYLDEAPSTSARNTAQAYVGLLRAAARVRAVPDAGARLQRWAEELLPRVFSRLVLEQTDLVETAADGLEKLVGPLAAIRYVLDRMALEPTFLERIGDDLWSETHWNLARWRKKAGSLGDQEERLLVPVLASLETWLQGGPRTGHGFWRKGDQRFWAEKAHDFAATAGKVVELNPNDPTVLYRTAGYLRTGLGRHRAAVEVLLAARDREMLTDAAHLDLGRWLVQDQRYADAMPILEELLELRPDVLEVRLLRSKALDGVGRGDEALALLRDTEARWREREQWTASVAMALGGRALEQGQAAAAETWLDEAARLQVKARRGRGGADAQLSRIYGLLARARVLLGKTDAAVDAASAAIVAWGPRHKNRRQALEALERVLVDAKDLDAFVERYEARVAAEGLDAPVIRKALAAVFTKKARHAQAVEHLLAARDLAPEDAEIHRRLVAAYDALGEKARAVDALMTSLRFAPRNLDAAADLARRFAAAGQSADAERARTNLVEPLPHEADGHRRLATIRETEKRKPEAIVQWKQVVRTEPLDPTGWLALARAEIADGRKADAKTHLEHVIRTGWEQRFGDVKKEARTLLGTLDG